MEQETSKESTQETDTKKDSDATVISRFASHVWETSSFRGSSETANSCPPFDESVMHQLVSRSLYDPLYEDLLYRIDTHRCSRALTWCHTTGWQEGHVPLLYLAVRNGCRFTRGMVPNIKSIKDTLRLFVFLCLRIIQDTVSLQRTQGLRHADKVYHILVCTKLRPWLTNLNPMDSWPTLPDIVESVQNHRLLKDLSRLPDHAWITAVRYTHLSTVRFGTPDQSLKEACADSLDAVKHKKDVTQHFFEVAKTMQWSNFLSASLEVFIPKTNVKTRVPEST